MEGARRAVRHSGHPGYNRLPPWSLHRAGGEGRKEPADQAADCDHRADPQSRWHRSCRP